MDTELVKFVDTPCLNCGSTLTGPYCAECGQPTTDVNISVKSLVMEFAESLFSLEFGFWQTFKRLVFFTGSLTREYIAGRRKRYSSPIRLYLGTSLLFFFLIGIFGVDPGDSVRISLDGPDGEQVLVGKEGLEALREGLVAASDSTAQAIPDSSFQAALEEIPGNEFIGRALADPEAAQARFFSYLPRAMFLMVPLAALLFRLVYVRHKRPYLHYLVFALHLHALFYLTASLAGLIGLIQPENLGDGLALLVLITFPINTVRAQRRTFGDSWFKALVKAGLVWHVYGFFLVLVIGVVMALTVVLG